MILENKDEELYWKIKIVKRQIAKQKDRMRFLSYTDEEKDKIIKSSWLALLKKHSKERMIYFDHL